MPRQGKEAFAGTAKDYEQELKRTDHYMITSIADRLLICSLNGDKLSQKRLLALKDDFAGYYNGHEDSRKLLDERLSIYHAYKAYLDSGGR